MIAALILAPAVAVIAVTKPLPISAQFRFVAPQFAPVPLDFSHVASDFRFSLGDLAARCSSAYVAAQLGAITSKFSEIPPQLRPAPLNVAVILPDCFAPFPMQPPAVGESRIVEQ